MPIDIIIVKEDLITVIKEFYGIKVNDDFFKFRQIAREKQCSLIITIDYAGDTIINHLQVAVLKKEIQRLKEHSDINQHILDQLQEVADAVDISKKEYIRFVGD
ncbi:MAG TPA: hypothetical protein VFF04_06940 [Candidatus Babeliales bacterium]|nr:hypothetical protein [Candidatus Babeliales bacterium]